MAPPQAPPKEGFQTPILYRYLLTLMTLRTLLWRAGRLSNLPTVFSIPVTYSSLLSSYSKPADMKKSILLRYVAGTLILAVSLLFIGSAPKSKTETPCCKKNMEQCPGKKSTSSPNNMIWETFTRKFVVISPFRY